jgi:octaprenyl-diphosphate synthase
MKEVDRLIAHRLSTGIPMIGEICRHIVSSGGKRLRPALLLLTCGALGFSAAERIGLAVVVEFIHTATLLHDDVVDESTVRRGRPTANEAYGNAASVLVGDFLYSRAFQMMVATQNLRAMEILADATNIISEGEVQQLLNVRDVGLDEHGYMQVIRSKTAKLFEASARLGAILAGSTVEIEQSCADYGQALGTAFQVIDDVLDYDGATSELGKNLGDDLREGKVTLPIIVAMQRCSAEDRDFLRDSILTGGGADLDRVIAIVRSTGSIEAARFAAALEAKRAISAIGILPASPYKECLLQLADRLLDRRS